MKRRNFLGGLITFPIVAKGILSNETTMPISNIEKINAKLKKIGNKKTVEDIQSEIMTEYFFYYLKVNRVKFNWVKMELPTGFFNGKPFAAITRKLNVCLKADLVCDGVKFTNFSRERKNDIMRFIVKELEYEMETNNIKTFYFYQLRVKPIIYDPLENFNQHRGILIRYAREK